ncbi:WGR domain-containing protein [Limnohabitans sp. 2KL-1]|uniref:WGR domain-containing protein n=1 Tax=Limnohabitans sp. 2KL-1 TaxID=1100699 RepID=UPI000D3B9410|nr:WGR domain-containing protein [Limnohabitans sp. 2KL-1]
MTTGHQKRYFEFRDEKSAKFWEVTTNDSAVTVRYGKFGTNGQTQTKELADVVAATKHVAKLVAEKTAKGYVESGQGSESLIASQPLPAATPAKKTASTDPAKDPEASSESLLALLNKDDTTNRLLARHPRASADLLEKLSHSSDKATRQGVAANPNTQPATYVKLGQQFPKEFLANPALDLLLMVNPALMEEVPEALLVRLVKQADCPASLLTWAAGQWYEKIQLAVAMNASATEEARQRLQESEHQAVREAVRGKPGTTLGQDPEQAFEQAVRERLGSLELNDLLKAWSSGDIGLAQWSALPITFRLEIASHKKALKGIEVGMLPQAVFARLASLPCAKLLRAVVSNPNAPVQLLEALAKDEDPFLRMSVAENPSTPIHVLEALANDEYYFLRSSVAKNPSTPPRILEVLGKDESDDVRCEVAINPNTTVQVLEALAKDKTVAESLVYNPITPAHLLAAMAKSKDHYVRSEVAANPSTPLHVLEVLAKDKNIDVRCEVAANQKTPAQVLEVLGKGKNIDVRRKVAANPNTSVHTLEALAKDEYSSDMVATNPNAPVPLLEVLANDGVWTRSKIAVNPNTPVQILEALAKDSNKDVRSAVAYNPNTPVQILEALAKDKNLLVALANQAHRSYKIFQQLRTSSSKEVQSALRSARGLSPDALESLLEDAQEESEWADLLCNPSLSPKTAEIIVERFLNTPATDSPWYLRELSQASAEIRTAAESGSLLSYTGKDPNKAVLAKRALAPLMALCAGPFIEPARLVKVVGSTDWLVRAAVARNPGTPPNLIKKLSGDAHPLVASLAKRSLVPNPKVGTTSDNLDEEDLNLARAVAEVMQRIRQIAGDKPVMLCRVVSDDAWGDQVDVGEVMNSLRVMGKIDRVLPQVCSKLGQKLQPLMWEMGAKATEPKVRLALAQDPQCPVGVITRLAEDDSLDVVLAALKNPVLPPENRTPIIQGLLKLRGSRLAQVACNSNAPPELLETMATSRDEGIRSYAAGNRSTPESVLLALSKDADFEVRLDVASNPSTPVPVLEALSKSANHEVKQQVAANCSTPASVKARVLEALSKSAKAEFRISVAKNPFTPSSVLEALSKDSESLVRRAVAGNPSAPVSLLEIFSEDSDISILKSVAANRATPGSVLEALFKNSEWHIREKVAGNPSTSSSVLEALSMLDPMRIEIYYSFPGMVRMERSVADSSIKRAVAANPSTPLTALDTLSRESDDQVRLAVALNPSTSVAALSCLARDPNEHVAITAAFNPSAPFEVRESHIECWLNRMERAIQREACILADKTPVPQTPISTDDLLRALEWLDYLNQGADNKVLTKASRSKDWLTRLGAALHPGASAGILKLLLQDSEEDVAGAARFRLQATT